MRRDPRDEADCEVWKWSEKLWLLIFIPVSLAVKCYLGALGTILGPTQPYLARMLDTDLSTISLQWTVKGGAWMFGSVVTSVIFKRFLKTSKQMLLYYVLILTVGGLTAAAVPFAPHVYALFGLQMISYSMFGAYATSNAAHFVLAMGSKRSRPVIMSIHMLVGVGFFLGTLIAMPFLPNKEADETADKDFQSVCLRVKSNSSDDFLETVPLILGLPSIVWPYLIIGLSIVFISWLFIPLALLEPVWVKMPRASKLPLAIVKSEEADDACVAGNAAAIPTTAPAPSDSDLPDDKKQLLLPLLLFVFLFYFFSCGIERIFQATVFTLGLCGPLSLAPKAAAISDSAYNGSFMLGRVVGTVLAFFMKPRNMIATSLVGCFIASVVLCTVAFSSAYGLYLGSAVVGFTVSWQFGAAFSWTAQKVDVTGFIASLFSTSCAVSGMAFVPIVALLTEAADPSAMVWCVLAMASLQALVFGPMWYLGNRLKREKRQRYYDIIHNATKEQDALVVQA